MKKITYSVLDLSMITKDGNAATAIERTVDLAQHAEKLGYERVWLAEHHNMEFIASSATSVLIGHVAAKTSKIRVGSGGIMLPNHAPLAIAEQFGTLETMYPNRIDLGLGRAPGTDQQTAAALRRGDLNTAYQFPNDVVALQKFFSEGNKTAAVRAFPAEGLDIPIWILGSSTDSAYLAAEMGLPYAFASHFAPKQFKIATQIYRNNFRPSPYLDKPYVLACVNGIAADTIEEAELLSMSLYKMFSGILTNARQPLSPPIPNLLKTWPQDLLDAVLPMTACSFIGDKDSLIEQFSDFADEHQVDEFMITGNIYDNEKRLKSYGILAEVFETINRS
ncbi:LLM class flavin-dependent oxidoreductase [Fluviicola taffensis]|uniref:Luciferase-like monooxygenase n=1 Tax=Fluviicola taffensis (strain DSM 16823 / NCIMB 13979 / RW262) TaxID=755732 RepID=F2IER9_FLUTR|nr:LLM class flavin-dependent oxidoreductase [Fluviicola taffensis]AEA45636.1 luciferase family oxidoreductase, group 1 [Fluviicola taffensis DSM 16823]